MSDNAKKNCCPLRSSKNAKYYTIEPWEKCSYWANNSRTKQARAGLSFVCNFDAQQLIFSVHDITLNAHCGIKKPGEKMSGYQKWTIVQHTCQFAWNLWIFQALHGKLHIVCVDCQSNFIRNLQLNFVMEKIFQCPLATMQHYKSFVLIAWHQSS